MGKTLEQLRKNLFSVRLSVRYHRSRQRFFESVALWISLISALSATAVGASVLASGPAWLTVASTAIVAIAHVFGLVVRPSAVALNYNDLARQFISLERDMLEFVGHEGDLKPEDVQSFVSRRLSIEEGEPPTLTWLALRSRNEQIVSMQGIDSKDTVTIPFLQKLFIQFVDLFPYQGAKA